MTAQLTPQNIALTVLLFFVLVTIHEWGHYYFAKRAGILVREFAIGFGPKVFAFRRGETKYTLRLLPFGGYVRMAGEDPETVHIQTGQTIAVESKDDVVTKIYLDRIDERMNAVRGEVKSIDMERLLRLRLDVDGDEESYKIHPKAVTVARGQETQIAPWDRQFGGKPVSKRALAIFAGPMMNVILAAALFVAFAFMNGIPTGVAVNKVNPGEPAEAAGIRAGDVIQSIDGVAIGADTSKIRQLVTASADRPLEWVVLRGGKPVAVQMTPIEAVDEAGNTQIRVGVEMTPITRPATLQEGLTNGLTTMWSATKTIFEGFKMLILGQFTLDDLGGPIRMAEMTMQLANAGMLYYTWWAAMLSLYLAIFNLLPVPALDGSRLIFLGLEAIRGRPVDPNRESLVHFIGFAMLMLLMVAVTYNDILRLFRG
ncbi:RIP metalloprotease RseP [Paenibacillus sp.]|uniref:RIP metalloprotease RseP n=1 Tax=Paenibacillus sp. TaxID=58172 RepID=UPI002D5830E0|nr:RIP metalloprotease RseP [Paenibacillus sp.]HZG58330.1 RIP metalloprotease RseP [Paenibacillus sp.]